MVIGTTTPSFDLETEVDQHFDISHLTETLVLETTHQFKGELMQAPPIYSAAYTTDGKRAYKKSPERTCI
jgi:tRNA pseudouridine55 synthase